jgi:two-component system invasion response regulator UvrY
MTEVTPVPIRLLIADDQPAVRKSIRRLLSEFEDLFVAGEASDGGEVMDKVRTEPFDLVILDITMPQKNGLDVLRELKQEWPSLPVLILSIYPADDYRDRAIALGAAGYVTKDRAPDELVDEVRRATHRT